MLSRSREGDVHQCWDPRASAQSTGKLHTKLLEPRFIVLSYEPCQMSAGSASRRDTPKLRDWGEQCISLDVTGSTRLVLDNTRHRHVCTHPAAHQEQVLHCLPRRLW